MESGEGGSGTLNHRNIPVVECAGTTFPAFHSRLSNLYYT